jgi:hypothetical protein
VKYERKMGQYMYSILPLIWLEPWFTHFRADRHTITLINIMMSNHICVKSHLHRIGIMDNKMCSCEKNYETLDHILRSCPRFEAQRIFQNHCWVALHNPHSRSFRHAQLCVFAVNFLSSVK